MLKNASKFIPWPQAIDIHMLLFIICLLYAYRMQAHQPPGIRRRSFALRCSPSRCINVSLHCHLGEGIEGITKKGSTCCTMLWNVAAK